MAVLFSLPALSPAYSAKPDLTAAGAIATLKADSNSSPVYGESYNLGATGLRGWVYRDPNNMGNDGLQTAQDRQILLTVVGTGTPAAVAGLAVDDVILGVKAGSGTVPAFTSDCRKAFGWAIVDAETAAYGGVLSLLRWRTGTTTTVSITLPVMGSYTDTMPYSCTKSALILAKARTKLVSQLLSDPNFLGPNYGGAITGLALMAGVAPGDANYAAVQTRLQALAHALAPADLTLSGCDTWNWGYIGIFLSEYYLRSVADGAPDASVLNGLNAYVVGLAKGQSKYGTFGHGGAEAHADGSLHGSISWYGPVNSAGIPANVAIVMGKKALVVAGSAIDPEIDPAIARGSKFFGWYVNKGAIPYGEHEPYGDGHASNGKDAMCAVLFGMQDDKPVEAEYFARMTVAGCTGREYGHTGQGFSYLWGAMGANMGGQTAASEYLKTIRWHLDLERRTDGSFVYDGGEQYGGGSTSDGTYLGACSYNDVNPTATYILTYALPLQRLYVTGRDANPAHTLDATKVANAIAAATFKQDCTAYSVATLITYLNSYDPPMRSNAATELAKRTLTSSDISTLIIMAEGTDTNARMGACEALGDLKNTTALAALGRRLSDSDPWVRGKAANALKNFASAASPQLATMLTAFSANATDPNVIVWNDPVQIANGYLADTLFQALATNTNALSGSSRTALLYPALRAGLNQPDGMARMYMGDFIQNKLTLSDVQAVAPSIVAAAAERSPADRMFSDVIRYAALHSLAKYSFEETIPLCLMVKEQTWHGDDWDPFDILTAYRGAAKEALPTLYKWQAHLPQFAADSSTNTGDRLANITTKIASTIAAIENDASPPALVYFKSLTTAASPAAMPLTTPSSVLTATLTDSDSGTPNFIWSKVRGAGSVSFSPSGMTGNVNCTATFNMPGTYVLRATAVDRTILDYNTWITYCLGYYDFQTYNQLLGAVTKDLTVTVTPDPNSAALAQNQSLTTPPGTAAAITLAASDANGDTLSYAVVTQPAHGALSGTAPNLTYTPATGYVGLDSFTFKANDGKVDSAVAAVTIDVGASGNHRPVAVNLALTTAEDTAKTITLSGSDADSDPLVYQIVIGPAHGTLLGTPPNLTYQPAANFPAGSFIGADSFTFTVRDAALTSAAATVSIAVTPVNDAPQAVAQSVSVSVNTANPITLAGLDAEGYVLAYTVASNPSHGTLTGSAPNLTYQPTANYHGADSFTFKVTDSEGVVSSAAAVTITIINDAPVANPQVVELSPNIAKAVTLTGTDNCNDALTFTVLTQPTHGALSGTAPNLTYTPTASYTGADSFTFKANDGANDSAAAVVTLNVVGWQTWTNILAGSWSATASWSGGLAPPAGGSIDALLVFNTSSYSGTSSNNLTGSFQLNRITLGSALPSVTLSGNALAFALNSATLPQLNQNSSNAVTISNAMALAASTTIGGSGTGDLTFSGILSGAGGLTKAISGNLTLSAANTYSGGTIVSGGALMLGNRTGFGSGPLTLAGGVALSTGFEGNSSGGALPNAIVLSGGMVSLDVSFGGKDVWISTVISGPGGLVVDGGGRTQGLSLQGTNTFQGGVTLGGPGSGENPNVQVFNVNSLGTGTLRSELTSPDFSGGALRIQADLSAGVANPIYLVTGARLVVNTNPDGTSRAVKFTGPVSGGGSLVKTGTGTMTLSGAATYTGATKVTVGTLACSTAASLGQGPLAISSGAKVALNFTGTRLIDSLSLAGVAQPNGTYSATTSSTYLAGTGTVTVAPLTSTALALTGGVTPANLGDALTFTATVTGNTPTGNVAFYAGATLLGTSALNGFAQASLTASTLASGSYSISAQYAGDGSNGTSTSSAVAIQVLAALTAPVAPTGLVATAGSNSVGLTWNASGSATSYTLKRATVSGGPYMMIGTSGGASYADATPTNGTTYFYVVSATNAAGESANSAQASAMPTTQPSMTILASSPGATGPYGTAVTLTATLTAGASGTVTFMDGVSVLGATALSAGQAVFTTAVGALAVGSHSFSASYAGDSNFGASGSAALGYTVTKKPLTISGVTAVSKVYDQTTSATLTGGALAGVLSGETVTVVAGSGSFASANVGTWAVTATAYALGGTNAGNYVLSAQPSVPNASITPRPLQLAGTRPYDATATVAAGILSITNNLDAANLTLTGNASLAAKDVGARALVTYATPVRVQSATGNTGTVAATSFGVTLGTAPLAGNTLIAVISTRGTSANTVTAMTQSGVSSGTWRRACQSNSSIMTTEIWYAPNLPTGAGTAITINQPAVFSAAVVMEYGGILAASALDQIATAIALGNGTAALTGTTPATTQSNELWIGGIGYNHSGRTLTSILNSFTLVDFATSTNSTTGSNARVNALERMASSTGTASSGGTINATQQWTGTIATFKAASLSTLALSGSAAANYTLAGVTGSVTITTKALTVSGLVASGRAYNGTPAAVLTGTPTLLATQAAGSGSSADGKPYLGDTLTLGGTPAGVFADKHAATAKPVTVGGITLGGAAAANYSLTQPTGLTAVVAQLPLTVAAVPATKTYDRTSAATGTPTLTPALAAGDSATVLSQVYQDPNAGAGNKAIVPNITISDGNGGANYALTLSNCTTGTIDKAAAGVTLGGLARSYDGAPKAVTATTDPAGLTVALTYDAATAAPSAQGSYAVVATVSDVNHSGTANGTLVIGADALTVWHGGHFSPAEITAGLAADSVDADGDGLSNLVEFTLGTDPRSFTLQALAVASAPDNQFTLTFVARRAAGAGYASLTRKYTVESSADLSNPAAWQPVSGFRDIVGEDQTIQATLPGTDSSKFYRLNVRLEE